MRKDFGDEGNKVTSEDKFGIFFLEYYILYVIENQCECD